VHLIDENIWLSCDAASWAQLGKSWRLWLAICGSAAPLGWSHCPDNVMLKGRKHLLQSKELCWLRLSRVEGGFRGGYPRKGIQKLQTIGTITSHVSMLSAQVGEEGCGALQVVVLHSCFSLFDGVVPRQFLLTATLLENTPDDVSLKRQFSNLRFDNNSTLFDDAEYIWTVSRVKAVAKSTSWSFHYRHPLGLTKLVAELLDLHFSP
jgi:hypothetical protein